MNAATAEVLADGTPARPDPETGTELYERVGFVLGCAVYAACLQWSYVAAISPLWEYGGYTYNPPPNHQWGLCFLLSLLPSLWMPVRLTRPSQWLYLYLYLSVFVPVCFVPLFRAGDWAGNAADLRPLLVVLTLCMAAFAFLYRLPPERWTVSPPPSGVFWVALVGLLALSYAVTYATFGGIIRMVSLADVLDQRLEARDVLMESRSVWVGYALNLPAYAINTFLMAYGLWHRRWGVFAAGVGGQLFVYSVAAGRGALATVVVILMLAALLRQRRAPFGLVFVWLLAGLVAAGTGLALVGSDDLAAELTWVIHRSFIGPAYLTDIYYEFFSEHPQTSFSHVRGFTWLGENPYADQGIPLTIGEYLGQRGNNANANLWADGYAGLGFAGVVLVTLVTMVIFYAMDSALVEVDCGLAVLAIGSHALNVADLPIYTLFLGGGLAASILLMWLAPRRQPADAVPA